MRFIALLIITLLSGTAFSETLSVMNAKLKAITQNKNHLATAIQNGQDRAALCGFCHGATGISSRPYIPNLAGQPPAYLWRQFDDFANGKRMSKVMQPLSRNLSRDDRINLSLFYSSLPVESPANDNRVYKPELVHEGKTLYRTQCIQCHDKNGEGKDLLPRLAGQKLEYIKNTLALFVSPQTDKGDALLFDSERSNPVMVSIVKKLRPEQIHALATYLASLR